MSEVLQMPSNESPRERVAAEVRAHLARARLNGSRLATALGQSQTYWSRRLTGRVAFDVDDLSQIADLIGVEPSDFFATSNERSLRPRGEGGGSVTLPRLDLNQRPSD
ncbi:helix-turn-helix domain-containing protein [Sanguibacter massiliensis]|uniref:helix-turn-helix domain-containing protein n=2 Tax=Sanguibacter TaxID=60919 RepID=UPI00101AEB46